MDIFLEVRNSIQHHLIQISALAYIPYIVANVRAGGYQRLLKD